MREARHRPIRRNPRSPHSPGRATSASETNIRSARTDRFAHRRCFRSCGLQTSFCILPQADEIRGADNARPAEVRAQRPRGEVAMQATAGEDATPVATGVPGLDEILAGGYASNRAHLVEGRPGSVKTTLGLQFLLDGMRRGEICLYITLSESKRELLSVAERHGWSLEGLNIYELIPPELSLDPRQQQSLVHTSDLELGETVQMALAEVARVKPTRVVFDSLSEIRLLSQGSLRYRRQVLALKHFFLLHNATVLLLDDLTAHEDDLNLHSLSHAIIHLEQLAPAYGV